MAKTSTPKEQIQADAARVNAADKDSYTRTFEHLEKQEKVNFMLPAGAGLPPELVVNINGVQFIVEAGKICKLPLQVVEMLNERMQSEGILQRKSEEQAANLATQ